MSMALQQRIIAVEERCAALEQRVKELEAKPAEKPEGMSMESIKRAVLGVRKL